MSNFKKSHIKYLITFTVLSIIISIFTLIIFFPIDSVIDRNSFITYSFNDVIDGTTGTSINFISLEVGDLEIGISEVKAEEDGRKKVLKFGKNGDGTNYYSIHNRIQSLPQQGVITWYWKHKSGDSCQIYLTSEPYNTLTWISLSNNSIGYWNDLSWKSNNVSNDDSWFFLKFQFDVHGNNGRGFFKLWVNDLLQEANGSFYEKCENLYTFRLQIESESNGISFIDDVNYSWNQRGDSIGYEPEIFLLNLQLMLKIGFIFYLFIILLTLFGFIIYSLINTKLEKKSSKYLCFDSFLMSFLIGISIFIPTSLIILALNIFNFFTIYLPLILIDISFLMYIILNKKSSNNFKNLFRNCISKYKRKKSFYLKCFLSISFIFLLQVITQLPFLFDKKSLIFSDPFLFYNKVSIMVENGIYTDTGETYFYPPGFYVFCSGALLIAPNSTIVYYFLKLGGFFLLNLFLVVIFFLSLKILRKFYIALFCTILSFTYLIFMLRINFFPPSSLSTFLILIGLVVIISKRNRIFLLGALFAIIYLIHPISALFYYFLFIPYFVLKNISLNRKYFIKNFKEITKVIIIAFIFISPYFFFLVVRGRNPFDLIELYNYILGGNLQNYQLESYNGSKILMLFQYFDNLKIVLFQGFFLDNYLTITHWTIGSFLFLTFIGLFYNASLKKKENKQISLMCKLSLILILIFYTISFFYEINTFFFQILLSRISEAYFPLIIILTGFGIKFIEKAFLKLYISFNQRYGVLKLKFLRNLKKKRTPRMFVIFQLIIAFLLFSSYLNFYGHNIDQLELQTMYFYSDSTIEMYLIINENIPKGSTLATPNFSHHHFEINDMLYNYHVITSNFTFDTTFYELEFFVSENIIDYILLEKMFYSNSLYVELLNKSEMTNENGLYYLVKMK